MDSEKVLICSNDFLRPIGESILIGPTSGTRTFAQAGEVFNSIEGLETLNFTGPREPKPETQVTVLELIKEASFDEFFTSLNMDLDQLYLSQDQITEFCVVHRHRLKQDDGATFFLLRENNRFFVAIVRVFFGDNIDLNIVDFEEDHLWPATYKFRVVVCQ